jgi:hypothetical protein
VDNASFTVGGESSRFTTPTRSFAGLDESFVRRRPDPMLSLPFILFACGLAAGWTRRPATAMGFWLSGVLVLIALFRVHGAGVLDATL